jgi:hypothetical protein
MLVIYTNKFTLKKEFKRRKKGNYKDNNNNLDLDLNMDASVIEV